MPLRTRVARIAVPIAGLVLSVGAHPSWSQPTPGFLEEFSGASLGGFTSIATLTNPGTGGYLGAGDGFLRIASAAGNLGANSSLSLDYAGNFQAAGVTEIRVYLNDVGTDQALEMHLGIGNQTNMWQYNTGFLPPNGAWGEYVVPLNGPAGWTQIVGLANTFQNAIQNADRILIRHDLAPYTQSPNTITGDVGVDHIQLKGSATPVASTSWSRIKTLYR